MHRRVVKATPPRRRNRQHMHAVTVLCLMASFISATSMLQLSHGTLLVQGVSSSLRASQNLRSRTLQTSTCSLEVEQDVWANLSLNSGTTTTNGHQIVVSQDESLIVTVDVDYTKLVAWSKIDGTYTLAGVYDKPSSSEDLRGLMLHLGLPIVYTISTDENAGTDEVFIYEFDSGNASLSVNGSVQLVSGLADQADLLVDSAYSASGIAGKTCLTSRTTMDVCRISIVGNKGGVRRFFLDGVGDFGVAMHYKFLGRNYAIDGTALAFSPDGSIVYIASDNQEVYAYVSAGDNNIPFMWSTAAADNDLCDIVVSPSGLSVYVLGCANSVVIHLQLDETTGEVLSTGSYAANSSVAGSTSGSVFAIQAIELAVMVGRSDSDEIAVFQRNATDGVLSSATTVRVTSESESGTITVAGFALGETERLFVSTADSNGGGGIVVFNHVCPTAAPSPSPSPAPVATTAPSPSPSPAPVVTPTSVPNSSPTLPLSTVPELVEARLAAAVHGVNMVFEPGPGSLGLWCHDNICSETTCSVADLLESGTIALVGAGASCSWKDENTVVVTFGSGYTLAENSTVVLNGGYIAGCATCTEYASGSTLVLDRALPPELSSAKFTNTGAQVTVGFTGNPSSQEINGTFGAVPCESVFSAASASTLGIRSTCHFVSGSSIKVTLGALSTITPSSSEGCTDGDGTSLTLLAGVVRTEIGAFLTASAGCVVVDYPSNPDPPFVEISAPGAVGYSDDLTLEGRTTMSSIGSSNVTWEVAFAGSDPTADISNVSRALEQASSNKELTVTIPSEDLAMENTFSFVLRVETVLGGSSEAAVEVHKSSLELLVTRIVGSSALQRTRGNEIILRSETRLSSCSTLTTDEALASYSWRLVSANESYEGTPEVVVDVGRDPRVLVIPSYTLGYAGSTYLFQLTTAFGSETTNTANVTIEIVSGPIVAAISGGTKRSIGVGQARTELNATLELDASVSVDTDGVETIPFNYTWHCESESEGACVSMAGEVLDLSGFAAGAMLSIPPGSLPSGIVYVFAVTASKHSDGSTPWSKYRSDNTSCIISTTGFDVPHVAITPKEIHRKFSPSRRLVLYGCAAASIESHCSNSTFAGFDFQWNQVDSNIGLLNDDSFVGNDQVFRTGDRHPTLVVRAGALSPGRTYTFSMTATGSSGRAGYSEFSIETNDAPVGGHVSSDLLQVHAGEDAVMLQTLGWTDDFEDLPMTYEFGYSHGWHEIRSVSRQQWITRLSSGASSSSTLLTDLPPGTALNAFNITLVAFVSDILGATAVTSLGIDGVSLSIVSYPPEQQVMVSSLRANLSSLSTGASSLTDTDDALRSVMMLSAVLGHAPEPETADEIGEMLELKHAIITFVAEAYLAMDSTSGAARIGAEALAAAVTSHAENGILSSTTVTEVSGVVEDMLTVSTEAGDMLEYGPAVSILQTVGVLLHKSNVSSSAAEGNGYYSGRNGTLMLLGSLGRAVAIGSEAGEEVDQVSTGSVDLQAAKVAESSIHEAVISVGENGAQVSFEDWMAPAGVEDNSTFVVAVTSLGTFESEGPKGIIAINAWDKNGKEIHDLVFPVKFFVPTEVIQQWTPDDVTPTCGYWSEVSNEWKADGVVLGSANVEVDGTSSIICWTFHLSPFAVTEKQSAPIQWITVHELTDTNVLQEYWAESWPAILFLGIVVVTFLAPAACLHWKGIKGGVSDEYLDILRHSYLDCGRCSREDQPVQTRIRERTREARKDVNNRNQLDSGYLQTHEAAPSKPDRHWATVTLSSILMNHPWRHLWVSPTEHFKKTLLTRSQHLVILLADWMSALTLQAIFYGKSQFSIREKAEMTVVTALFMIPTALAFPSMMRSANTPPSSDTLALVRKHKTAKQLRPFEDHDHYMGQDDLLVKTHHEDFQATVSRARAQPKNITRGSAVGNAIASRGEKPKLIPPTGYATGGVGTSKTDVYRDLVASQRVLVALFMLLPMCMAMFVPMVLRVMGEAEGVAGGNQEEFLHNLTASLGIACGLLCLFSAYGVVTHRVTIMSQAMAAQAVITPALILCGAVLFGSDIGLATGAVFGGLGTLLCAYFLNMHRKNELVVQRVCQEDLITTWSHPLPFMHSAALPVQRAFRMHRAAKRTTRAIEFNTWLNECKHGRSVMYVCLNSLVCVVILCLTYANLVFAIKFDRPTCVNWLTTCVLALVVEATLQRPVILLVTGVLGDFVEEGADFLLETLDAF
ncbi:unnamed protein product [Ectocarpus sp. 6 AP-2014]